MVSLQPDLVYCIFIVWSGLPHLCWLCRVSFIFVAQSCLYSSVYLMPYRIWCVFVGQLGPLYLKWLILNGWFGLLYLCWLAWSTVSWLADQMYLVFRHNLGFTTSQWSGVSKLGGWIYSMLVSWSCLDLVYMYLLAGCSLYK